ncbi:MAG: TetR family transcriptional regulator [Comamonadaceae bacterium]|nr:TetR family transcriptional regulator [Comamonadaceae bacterium]
MEQAASPFDLLRTTLSKEEGRAEILDAAAEAFMQKGFAATSINTVAGVLGCTKGRIYYQFESKSDLFFAVHREAMLMNINAVSGIANSEGKPLERLSRMIRAQAMVIMTRLPFQRASAQGLELHLAGSTTAEQREVLHSLVVMREQYENIFVDVVTEGIQCGDLRSFDPKFAVKPLLGALNWMTVWYRAAPGETEEHQRKIADDMADFLLSGLAASS